MFSPVLALWISIALNSVAGSFLPGASGKSLVLDDLLNGTKVLYSIITVAGKWRRPARRGYGGCSLKAMQEKGGDSNVCPDEIRFAKASAAIFYVVSPNAYKLHVRVPTWDLNTSQRDSSLSFARDPFHYQEGLVRLLCDATLFESVNSDISGMDTEFERKQNSSFFSGRRSGFEEPPINLFSIPISQRDEADAMQDRVSKSSMLASLIEMETERYSRHLRLKGSYEIMRLGLILNYTTDTENPHAKHKRVSPGVINNMCKLRFLPRLEQLRRPQVDIIWEGVPKNSDIDVHSDSEAVLAGTLYHSIERLSISGAHSSEFNSSVDMRAEQIQRQNFLPPIFQERNMIREEPLAESDRTSLLKTLAIETGRQRKFGGGPVLESEFLETAASAQNPAMGMISGPLNAVISAALPAIVPVAANPLSAAIAPAVAPGATEISQKVSDLMKPGLTLGLSTSLPDVLMEALPDSITEAVSEASAHVIVDGLTETMGKSLSSYLVKELSEHVALQATDLMSHKISQRLTKSLTATLGRSVSHALVPALVHTVSHNPLTDYYCYYCYYKKTYCSYCQYAPSQLYYTMCKLRCFLFLMWF